MSASVLYMSMSLDGYIVHVFSTEQFEGNVRASEEGELQWFPEDRLPFEQMFPDDPHWVPHLLAGRCFRAVFSLSEDLTQVIAHELEMIP